MPKTQKPKFTIVTPSYNQGMYLEETIKSVLNQTGDFSIQYIVADGGSTDNSVDIIKKYDRLLAAGKYPFKNKGVDFSWWSHPDKGQPDAINQGFKLAKADILAWVNSDDVYEKGAFAEVAKEYEKHPNAGIIYSNYTQIDSKSKVIQRADFLKLGFAPFDLDKEINLGNLIPTPSAFFNRQAVEKVNYINAKYQYAFDYDLFIKIAKEFPIIYVNAYWSRFRFHDTSKTVSLEKKFWPEEREISRAHGGKFFSQAFINHHDRRHHRTTFVAVKIARTFKLFAKGDFKSIYKKLMNNARHYLKV